MLTELMITAAIFTVIVNTVSLVLLNQRMNELEKKGEQ